MPEKIDLDLPNLKNTGNQVGPRVQLQYRKNDLMTSNFLIRHKGLCYDLLKTNNGYKACQSMQPRLKQCNQASLSPQRLANHYSLQAPVTGTSLPARAACRRDFCL